MGTTTAEAGGTSTLQQIYQPIRADLDRISEILRNEMLCRHPLIASMSDYVARFQGKRMRSALLLFSAKSVGGVREEHLALAAIVELIHLATLAHDDVLDESEKRRLTASLNARWGNEASVMFGDYLFSNAFALCAKLKSPEVTAILAKTTQDICAGELSQISMKGNTAITGDQYREIIDLKTAALFATACRLGTFYARIDEATRDRFARFGLLCGRAFQIVDDCLDLTGDEKTTGKPPGNDLAKGKYTLPIIRLLEILPPAERDSVRQTLSVNETPAGRPGVDARRYIQGLIERHGVLVYAREQAESAIAEAKAEIAGVDSPSTDSLVDLAEFTVTRRF